MNVVDVVSTVFQIKRGLHEAWERSNPILAPGEPGWELDTHTFKVGDGITPWNELDIVTSSEENYIEQIIANFFNQNEITFYSGTSKDVM